MLFCCFEAFSWLFIEKFSFSPKRDISERIKNTQKIFFLTNLNGGKPREKFGFVLNNPFCSKQLKGTNINKNCFSTKNEPHTAKLWSPVVLKHVWANSQKTTLFSQNIYISDRGTDLLRKKILIKFE